MNHSGNKTLKLGVFEIHPLVMAVKDDGYGNKSCSMEGLIGDVYNIILNAIADVGYNCTFKKYQKMGEFNQKTNHYDGALGDLQNGHLDSLAMSVYYPMPDPHDNFWYTTILYEDIMTMLSAYSTNTEYHQGTLLNMITDVPCGLWIGYVVSFIVFASVALMASRILKVITDPIWLTICAFLDQDNYPTGTVFMNIMSVVNMVGIFFMMSYIGNMMSSDMVTVDVPHALSTYDDAIRNDSVGCAIFPITSEWERFANSLKGSKERRLFEKRIPVSFAEKDALAMIEQFWGKKMVVLARTLVTRSVALAYVYLGNLDESMRALISTDPDAKKYANVFIFSAEWKSSLVYNKALKKLVLVY